MLGEFPGEVIARDDDADGPVGGGVTQDRARADQLATPVERLVHPAIRAAAGDPRRQPIGRCAHVAARQRRRLDRDERGRRRALLDSIDLDQADTPLGHFGRKGAPHGIDVGRLDGQRRHDPGDALRVVGDDRLAVPVVVHGDLVRGSEDVVDRLAEPAFGAAPNQLAADDQHQDRRNDRQAEHREHQLRAEARERQAAAPLDQELHDVARQHEHQRQHHRQVGGRQGVEHHLAEEIGAELRRLIGEDDHRGQRAEQENDAEEDQPRVVAERTALGRGQRFRRPRRERRAPRVANSRHGAASDAVTARR